MNENEQSMSDDTSRFIQLVALFQLAAMQQLGKLPNPVTNEIERDLQQAKSSIDMLDTIKKKTKGNLIDAEANFLDKVLFELHMNYVDEVERADKEKGKDADSTKGEGAESAEQPGEEPGEQPESPTGDDKGKD
jgi:hypothetical protein